MESELNRCRDKLDFCKGGVVILCVVIMLLSAMLYFLQDGTCPVHSPRSVNLVSFGLLNTSGGKVHILRVPDGLGYFRVGYEKGPWRVSWFDLGTTQPAP